MKTKITVGKTYIVNLSDSEDGLLYNGFEVEIVSQEYFWHGEIINGPYKGKTLLLLDNELTPVLPKRGPGGRFIAKDAISVTITKEDLEQAGPYHDGENCLIATALKRQGYKNLYTYPYKVDISSKTYEILDNAGIVENLRTWEDKETTISKYGYKDSLIGKTIWMVP